MAKKRSRKRKSGGKRKTTQRKRSTRRRRSSGVKGLKGLGQLNRKGPARDVLPATLGLGLTGATTLAVRAYVDPTPGTAGAAVYRNAPWIGVGVGGLTAGAMYMMGGGGPAAATLLASVIGGGFLFGSERLNAAKPGAYAALSAQSGNGAGAENGAMGALVPEYAGMQGMDAVMMEPTAGMGAAYGDEVALQGTIDTGAFGKESFRG